jgi:hypothetical protein
MKTRVPSNTRAPLKEEFTVSRRKHWKGNKNQNHAVREPRSKKVLFLALPLLALGLFVVGGCGVSQPEKPGAVAPTEMVAESTPQERSVTTSSSSLTPEGIAAEIIPQEGDPTSYGIPVALNNTRRFIDYYGSITLTPAQESIRHDALLPLKAPCCDDNSMYDC